MENRTIIAIDPGYDRCGVAIFSNTSLLHSTCIETKKTDPHSTRLVHIYSMLCNIINTWKPTHLALETLFFSVNKKTALKVAEARGVVLLAAGVKSLSVIELSPQEVKLSMTGVGNADKKQIQKMVALTFRTDTGVGDDEIDAIALGAAAVQKSKFIGTTTVDKK